MTVPSGDVALCIDPFTWHFEHDRLFDPGTAQGLGADSMNGPFVHLRQWFNERGIAVHTADRLMRSEVGARLNIVMSFGLRGRYHALARRPDVILSAYFGFESPVVDPKMYRAYPDIARHFRRLYSFADSEALVPFVGSRVAVRHFDIPYPIERVQEEVFRREHRKFLVVINHNKLPALYLNELYTERMRAIAWFAQHDEIDLYGRGWNGPPFLMAMPVWMPGTVQHLHLWLRKQWERVRPDPLLRAARSVYRGFLPDKIGSLGEYTWCLCFENVVLKGWITEKLFDCFVAGTIPIFLGAPDVQEYVPPECYVDMRAFSGYADLRDFLRSRTAQDIRAYRDAARAYMASEAFRRFGKQCFTETLGRIVAEDAGVELPGLTAPPLTSGVSHA